MIDIENIRILNLRIEGEDIEIFISLLDKLLIASNQAGFNKSFNVDEQEFIRNIAEELGLDNITKGNILAEQSQVNEK